MPSYEFIGNSQRTDLVLRSFVEEQKLDIWAKHISDMANVYVQCIDSDGNPLTELIGYGPEINKIVELVDEEQIQDMLFRVSGSGLEDQAIETTAYPNLKVAIISTKIRNKPVVNWLVCGVLFDIGDDEDYENPALTDFDFTLSMAQFYSTVDAVRDFATTMIENKLSIVSAEAESRRSKSSEEVMGNNLKRAEALTDIVQLLESDDPVEKIMHRMLEIIGHYLDIEGGSILRIRRGTDSTEDLAKYNRSQNLNDGDDTLRLNSSFLLKATKPLILSTGRSISSYENSEMEDLGLKALMIIPIIINDTPGMYACFFERENERNWSVEEIKFVNDSVKILQSILTRRVQKNSLASSYNSIETILDNVGSAVYVRELNSQKMLFANSIMKKNFGDAIRNGTINELLNKGISSESGASEVYYEEHEKYYDMYYTRISWVDGSSVLLCALYDVSEKKVYQKRIEQQAYTDFLTGLYNRMCCERDLAKIVDSAEKNGTTGAILYLDLDDFKHINDSLGHQYGDVLLKAISHSLRRIEGLENTCYRMGGDEFVIVIPPEVYDHCDRIVADIKDVFAKPWYLKDSDYYCTMSMGIVSFPEFGTGVHDLIKKADIAMYEAKKSGKNRLATYSDGIDSASGKRLDMEKNMRDATNSGFKEFEVYFQPIVEIDKGVEECVGAEALVRWNSQEMGFISPGEFIPLAEYLGLINPIGNYVLYDACLACRKWNDNGYPSHHVNVNLSVVQLLQNDIVEIVENTIKETGINPHNLTLEVTESLAINDMERMKKILANIKALGVKIALDDFGTGYSSLNHIREIPFDVIKVDQSFIKDLVTDSYAGSFVKMVGELAEALGVQVCVEGVETQSQLDILKQMPVNLIQGFYYSKPKPQEAFEGEYLPLLGR